MIPRMPRQLNYSGRENRTLALAETFNVFYVSPDVSMSEINKIKKPTVFKFFHDHSVPLT